MATAPGPRPCRPCFGGAVHAHRVRRCGSCMTGCRVGAKEHSRQNYLGLAESAGAGHRRTTSRRKQSVPASPTASGSVDARLVVVGSLRCPQTDLHRQRRYGGGHIQHAEAHARPKGSTLPKISDAWGADPHELGVDPRRHSEQGGPGRTSPGVAITSSFTSRHPASSRPLRQGLQCDITTCRRLLTDGGTRVPTTLD